MEISKYIGSETIKRMKQTNFFSLAQFISELRYNLYDADNDHYKIQKKVYMADNHHFEYAKIEDKYVDSNKALKLIEEELEGLALKEVT